MAMEIIDAVYTDSGETIPHKQACEDWTELQRQNSEALKEDPTWGMFGGNINIGNRRYQVMNY